ncbi:MAG: ribosome biogenesis GTPase Der [Actinomycetota bacterium]|nr:ribosome biogenesis GTPase Der [Actinomycetota bacterium]
MAPDGGGSAVLSRPVVAVVGRPNVGKSSLVNRVLGRREAIVEATPGVTRDRHGFTGEWGGRTFEIVDTGGLEPGARGLEQRVAEQAQVAMEAADVIVFVVDAATGPLQDDLVVAEQLRRSNKPIVVVANKVDDPRDRSTWTAFYRLGLGDPVPVSALHGMGSGDFLEVLVAALPEGKDEDDGSWASIAIVGRPNVGKSSILNRLTRSNRSIVDATPGTTRDPVDSYLQLDEDTTIRIVDTAGMRRQVRIDDPLEYFSFLRSRQTLARVDAAILVIDAEQGVTSHDQRIAEEILDHGRACVIALNKWDAIPQDPNDRARLDRDVGERLRFLTWAPQIRTSAVSRRGVDKLLPAVREAVESHRRRLSTPEVNRLVRDAQAARPHPRTRGKAVRILYAVQAEVAPPTFVLFANGLVEKGYLRHIEHRIRGAEPFTGTPLRVTSRLRSRRAVEG